MDKVAIIGGSGFIGSHLCDALKHTYDVTCVDIVPPFSDEYNFYECDVTNLTDVKYFFDRSPQDIVIYLAAIHITAECEQFPDKAISVNITGLANVLNTMLHTGATKFLFPSTTFVYQQFCHFHHKVDESADISLAYDGMHTYSLSKYVGEHLIRNFHSMYYHQTPFEYCIFRFGTTYGDRCHPNVIKKFLQCGIQRSEMTILGNSHNTRGFLYVSDHINAYICALASMTQTKEFISGVYNCDGPRQTTIEQVAQLAIDITGTHPQVGTYGERINDYRGCLIDNSKSKEMLGWEPNTYLPEGMKRLYKTLL